MMKVLLSVCCFLAITHYGLGSNEENLFSKLVELYEGECLDGKNHYYWYPYDCQKYYSCENGTLELEQCTNGLYWNDDIKSCDFRENVNCSNIQPFPDPDCSNNETAYYIYPYDCQNYYECYNGSLYILECPEGTLWNDDKKKCDDSGENDCSYIIPSPPTTTSTTSSTANTTSATSTTTSTTTTTTTTPATTTTTPATTTTTTATTTTTPATTTTTPATTTASTTTTPATTPNIACADDKEFYPYPYDCTKYYVCFNHQATLMQCPSGEYWNDEQHICDWPSNVDCVASTHAPNLIK